MKNQENSETSLFYLGSSFRSIYFVGESGVLKINLNIGYFALLASAFIIITAAIAIKVGNTGLDALLESASIVVIIFGPLVEELRYRTLAGLLKLQSKDLVMTKKSTLFDWETIENAQLRGNVLSLSAKYHSKLGDLSIPRNFRKRIRVDAISWSAKKIFTEKLDNKFEEIPRSNMMQKLTRFSILFLVLFVLAQVILYAASTLPFLPGEESHYAALQSSVNASLIGATPMEKVLLYFLNNIQVALGSLVGGVLVLPFGSYNTGRVIQVIALENNVSPQLLFLKLYEYPHSWIEEAAYPLAMALGLQKLNNFWVLTVDKIRNRFKRDCVSLSLGFLIVTVMILVAATLETAEAYLSVPWLLWIPVVLFCAILLIFNLKKLWSREKFFQSP